MSRSYQGALTGFVPTYAINDTSHDTHGYIGYTESKKSIYVVFRGSESIKNWVSNLDAVLTDYPKCSGCDVHEGFYKAEQHSINNILSEVKILKEKYPSFEIVVTGHSLGAALATLASVDIKEAGLEPVYVYTFGSPRVGDTKFAEWYTESMTNAHRITHHKDMVVHSPMHERFTHVGNELYEEDNTVPVALNTCSGLEDKHCAYQWHITSIDDHLWYMNVNMGENKGSCATIIV